MGYTQNLIEAFADVEEIDVSALTADGRTLEHRKIEIIDGPLDEPYGELTVKLTESPAERPLTRLTVGGAPLIGKFVLIKKAASNGVTRVRVWR